MDHTEKVFKDSKKYFPTAIQEFQFLDKYSRFNYDKGRRETWIETVDRAVDYLKELSENKLPESDYDRIRNGILKMDVAPSMRLLAMAGPAARRQNICIYNCSYTPIDGIDALVEILIIGMGGCGTGWSVEKQYVDQFPVVTPQIGLNGHTPTHTVEDSAEGWADAFWTGLKAWLEGKDVHFDYSHIRQSGKPLKTKGGTASGPEHLEKLMKFTRSLILNAQGRKLSTLEVHDIACKIAESIVSGGVRRVACISLFDWDDELMRNCKNVDLIGLEHRWMSNNSAVWPDNITDEQITKQMNDMFAGMMGEPGIFSRANANKLAPARRQEFGWKDFGTNPCGEINLRPYQFCNLSQAIIRSTDTEETLLEKIELATLIGTIQSMATHFPGLRPIWKKNCEEERLLGVDLNGEMDCVLTQPSNPDRDILFQRLKNYAVRVNEIYAKKLGINQSSSVTCIKPNGNAGVLYNCASGLHTRWAKYYIRNVRIQAQSPLAQLLLDQHVPLDPENGQTWLDARALVVHFPIKAPDNALVRHDLTALEQCENWLVNKKYYTEHNPSVTISYKESEKEELLSWILEHKDWIGGMSFLPAFDAHYDQMPNEEITKEQYEKLIAEFPTIDFGKITDYEKYDQTTASMELSCSSGACTIEDQRLIEQNAQLHRLDNATATI